MKEEQKEFLIPPPAAAQSLQSCPTLCNPMDRSPPGSCVHGIFQVGEIPRTEIGLPGVGRHFLLQGIFQTQGSNLHLLH